MPSAWEKVKLTLKSATSKNSASFSDVIPPESILIVPLEEVATIILTSLRQAKQGTTIMRHTQISSWAGSYPRTLRSRAERRLTEAWQGLEKDGLIAETRVFGTFESWFVTDKGQNAKQLGKLTYGNDDFLPDALLVDCIREKAKPLYLAGRYDDACVAALRQLEVTIRELSHLDEGFVGTALMREAFKPNVGPLTDLEATPAEQNAARDLFVGAIGFYRNPFAHRNMGITNPAQAASIILLANELTAVARIHAMSRNSQAADRAP